MNNQNTGQYGYVNRNGRLVPSETIVRDRMVANAMREAQKRRQEAQEQASIKAKERAGYTTTSTPKQQSRPVTSQQKQQSKPQQVKKQKPEQTYAERTVEREKKKRSKKRGQGVKNLCLTLSLIMILSAAKQMPFNIKGRITEIAAKNGEHNYMDDVFASDEKIEVINPKTEKTQKIQLEDAINKLEDYVGICKLIDDLRLEEAEYTELNDKEKKAAIALYEKGGLDALVELYKDNTSNPIEKARTARQLMFIRDHFGGAWIEKNGLKVTTAILEKTIKTAAIEKYGTFKPTEYDVVEIPSENKYPFFLVEIKDPVSGATDNVVFTPIMAGEYAQAMLTLRDLQSTDGSKLSEQEKLDKIQHALRIIRKCLGKEVEDFYGITYTKKVK